MLINELPTQSTRFIGRESESSEIIRLLSHPTRRLLTVVGQGGIGKTRLTIEIANQLSHQRGKLFPDGIYFVPLAPIPSPAHIALTIADALGIHFKEIEEAK